MATDYPHPANSYWKNNESNGKIILSGSNADKILRPIKKEIMEMIKNLIIGFAIVMMAMTGIVFADTTAKEQAAVTAAEQWLALVDAGNYADSWNEGAEYFKGAVTQEKWQQMLQSFRNPLGTIIFRKLKSKAYKTSLPGVPDGEYVVIKYKASYQNKKSAQETITAMLDKDGQWRVVGYQMW
jgi:hypothetical protein